MQSGGASLHPYPLFTAEPACAHDATRANDFEFIRFAGPLWKFGIALGALTVTSLLDPVVVTAHLAVATAFIAMLTWTTVLAFRAPQAVP